MSAARVREVTAPMGPWGMHSVTLIPLDAALEEFALDVQHRPLVRQIALRAGISGAEVKASYVKLHRVDGMHPLHVTRRGVEWFSSQVEAVSASGLPERVRGKVNRAGTENWAVSFPVVERVSASDDAVAEPVVKTLAEPVAKPAPTRVVASRAAPKPRPVERDFGVCETCWQARTAAGTCGCEG